MTLLSLQPFSSFVVTMHGHEGYSQTLINPAKSWELFFRVFIYLHVFIALTLKERGRVQASRFTSPPRPREACERMTAAW